MRAVDIIAKKRDGKPLTDEEICFVIRGFTAGEVADYQMSALLMAIFQQGMNHEETLALTREMLHSGDTLDFSYLNQPCIDKHSTGGVGDKTSLIIAPVVAAAGIHVPMISGRALAHSGGTLDKLESIPGFRTDLSLQEFQKMIEEVGVSLIGQTLEIAPADRKLYALRDVTATVPSISLIAGSIMSKKLAEGITGLVLDVKSGSGAFVKTEDRAAELANLLIEIARGMNKRCVALITDMNQPLGRMVGNALEVIEALDTLRGQGPSDLTLLCRELAAWMMVLGDGVSDIEEGRRQYDQMISSGAALNKMREIIKWQGGDDRAIDGYVMMPGAQQRREIKAPRSGYVQAIDTEEIGHASMLLGAGRVRLDTEIDHGVGLRVNAKLGDKVEKDSSLVTLYFNEESHADEVAPMIESAYLIGSERIDPPPLIKRVVGPFLS